MHLCDRDGCPTATEAGAARCPRTRRPWRPRVLGVLTVRWGPAQRRRTKLSTGAIAGVGRCEDPVVGMVTPASCRPRLSAGGAWRAAEPPAWHRCRGPSGVCLGRPALPLRVPQPIDEHKADCERPAGPVDVREKRGRLQLVIRCGPPRCPEWSRETLHDAFAGRRHADAAVGAAERLVAGGE
jgi:hypothetical protein